MRNGNGSLGLSASACAVVMAATLGVGTAEANAVQAMERYCNASWNNANISRQEWDDCTQETFQRLLERISRNRLTQAVADVKSRERRELNRCIWCTVKSRQRARRYFSLPLEGVPDKQKNPDQFPRTLEEVRDIVHNSGTRLTPRQRKILTHWMDGNSIASIAEKLSLSPTRVSDEKYKAILKLRKVLA